MSIVMQQSATNPEISFSEAAIAHLTSYLSRNPEHRGVRFSVKKTGCSGLSYVIDYVNEPQEGDMLMPLTGDYLVCVDKKSYPYLKNLHVDYVREGLNQKFVFNNPNQTGQCGCGESFTVQS